MSDLVKIRMHGIFAEKIGKEFNLDVETVPEAFHAINILTDYSWQRLRMNNVKDNLRYSILVNDKELDLSNLSSSSSAESVKNSELCLQPKGGLKSIEIVPVNEGGATFIIAVIVIIVTTLITLALMKPPKFDDFREIEDTRKGQSYLFSGPTNTVNEGGPIPLGYGRALIGSQVVAQSATVYYENADGTDANVSSAERVSVSTLPDSTSVASLDPNASRIIL